MVSENPDNPVLVPHPLGNRHPFVVLGRRALAAVAIALGEPLVRLSAWATGRGDAARRRP